MTEANRNLWCAVLTNDSEDIRASLQQGADIECSVGELVLNTKIQILRIMQEKTDSETPLSEHPFWSTSLWEFDSLPRGVTDYQEDTRTPLLAALHYDFAQSVQALLDSGADPNGTSAAGLTPLLVAVRRGNIEAAKHLLRSGADPDHAMPANQPSSRGHSPLVRAAGDGNLAMVTLLLEHGANVNGRDGQGRTALLAACSRPAEYGFWKDSTEDRTAELENPGHLEASATSALRRRLHELADEEQEPAGDWYAIITLLLEHGADVNAETRAPIKYAVQWEAAGTPLMKAAQRSDTALVARLLTAGASLEASHGTPLLHLALQSRKGTETVQLLLAAGVSPTERDSDGASPLGRAIEAGNLEGVKLLVQAGADLFAKKPEFGSTLLHSAAAHGQLEIARYLLDSGLDIEATCSAPSPAEQKAAREKRQKESQRHFPTHRPPPHAELLQPSGEPDTERTSGITPLMLAARANQPSLIAFLLERGADKNRRDTKGSTARDYALRNAEVEQRQRAFMTASQSSMINLPEIQQIFQTMPDASFRDQVTRQIEESQRNFMSAMENSWGNNKTTREETLALLSD